MLDMQDESEFDLDFSDMDDDDDERPKTGKSGRSRKSRQQSRRSGADGKPRDKSQGNQPSTKNKPVLNIFAKNKRNPKSIASQKQSAREYDRD